MSAYNGIAVYYDVLKRLVYGNAIFQSQVHFLSEIKPSNKILILGGGTGEILPLIEAQEIDYVESSVTMLSLATKRKCPTEVHFVELQFEEFESVHSYDVIITPFFLDLFSDEELPPVIDKVKGLLKADGKLLFADFIPPERIMHRFLAYVTHKFFRWTTGLCRDQLADIPRYLKDAGFRELYVKTFYRGFIRSSVFLG